MYKQISEKMLEFIDRSPTARFAVENIKTILESEGFEELFENGTWDIEEGGRYFVTRAGSSVVAFRIPKREVCSFHAVLSHTDSPCFKLKPNFDIDTKNFIKLAVDKYGGPVLDSFFDIPLSLAGSVVLSNDEGVSERLIRLERICMIPRVAPHLSKEQGTNVALDMLPIYSEGGKSGLKTKIAEKLGVDTDDILSHDLYLFPSAKGFIWGEEDEFVSGARIDDLQSVYTSLAGFMNSCESSSIPVFAALDNEEIGNGGVEGADSTFLPDVIKRIGIALGKSDEEYLAMLSESFFISADVAHARHPNHPELYDPQNSPVLNGGVAIKYNAQKRYTTTAVSSALFSKIAQMAQVPCQTYTNRSDLAGGSTLGHSLQSHLSVLTLDVGAPILSMHSACETAGAKDTEYLMRVFEMFYSTSITKEKDGYVIK